VFSKTPPTTHWPKSMFEKHILLISFAMFAGDRVTQNSAS